MIDFDFEYSVFMRKKKSLIKVELLNIIILTHKRLNIEQILTIFSQKKKVSYGFMCIITLYKIKFFFLCIHDIDCTKFFLKITTKRGNL
jgi:hypothetical protein